MMFRCRDPRYRAFPSQVESGTRVTRVRDPAKWLGVGIRTARPCVPTWCVSFLN
jgi:hypothetical protein